MDILYENITFKLQGTEQYFSVASLKQMQHNKAEQSPFFNCKVLSISVSIIIINHNLSYLLWSVLVI